MNKKFFAASALFAVSAAFASGFETWYGGNGEAQIQTGLGNETNTHGYWYSYNDNDDGGNSKVVWPVESDSYNAYDGSMDPVIEHCGGICGSAVLDKGILTYNPFVGIGFNVVGEDASGNPVPGDASAWGGLCITYTSSVAPSLELGLGEFDATIGYANPAAPLSKAAAAAASKAIPWSGFSQPSWYKGTTKISGEEAAKQLVSVKFKMQAQPGTYDFNICGIGPYDGSCPKSCGCCGPIFPDAINSVRGPSNAKATLLGRNLGISGVNSTAMVEVKNILGQVVAKASVGKNSTLDLSSLDIGVYMVQVTGESVNFVDKIVLK